MTGQNPRGERTGHPMNAPAPSRALGGVPPAVAVALALAELEQAAGWLAEAEAGADPVKHGRTIRAAWGHMLRLRRSLGRLTVRLGDDQARQAPTGRGGRRRGRQELPGATISRPVPGVFVPDPAVVCDGSPRI